MNKLITTTFLCLSIFMLSHFCQAQCHLDDWTALKALYQSTDGDNWNNNTGWMEISGNVAPPANCNLGNLYGVSLDENGRVSCIDLDGSVDCMMSYYGGNNLVGKLPQALGGLSSLTKLSFGLNKLSGNIPLELGNLGNLKKLWLASNQLSGSIPSELGNLSNLTELDLTLNELNGSIPAQLGNLHKLEILKLSDNQFAGDIPSQLGNLSNLKILSLFYNKQLTGSIPIEITKLTNLEILDLGSNKLINNIPPEINKLSNLEVLVLSDNNLTGSIPAELSELSNLNRLELSYNQFTGDIPVQLSNLSSLRYLWLNNNLLTGNIPSQLGSLNSLIGLRLQSNKLTGNIPSEIGDLSNLETLFLSDNQLSGSIPAELGDLGNLIFLYLNDNILNGCYPTNIVPFCTQLTSYLFENNYYQDGNNFSTSWEEFCSTGAGSCDSIETEVEASTNYSGNVSISLNNNQNILKNNVAIVYEYGTCMDYANLSNCNPVTGFNNLSANEALWAVTKAAEYFASYHNIEIPPVNIIVNNTDLPNDAKYNPTYNTIVLGNGDGIERNAMSAPDIVGHEYAHAVINNIKYLGNYKIPGALNESYADILGELIEHYCYGVNNNWVLGSQVMIDAVDNPKGLRNFSMPNDVTMKYQLPNTYKGEHWIDIDNTCFHIDYCGIHSNSGVHSYWFYLLANGGSGINDDGYSYALNGLGIDIAAAIVIDNLTNYLNPTSTFVNVRESSILSAQTLYPNQPAVLNKIMQAWDAVGVYEPANNPIEFQITNATQIDEEAIENYSTLITVQFDLSIDSINMDISGDDLCFNLHLPSSYKINELCIVNVYEPLTREEVTDTITNGAMNICINRTTAGTAKQSQSYPKIASKSSIIQFVVPIVVENLKGEDSSIEPINIAGYTKTGNNELTDFKPATLNFGSDFNESNGIEPQSQNTAKSSLTLNHKNCNSLGSLEIEILEDATAGPPFTYSLKNEHGNIVEEQETYNAAHQFFHLEEGTYKLIVTDSSNNEFSKQFSVCFVSEPNGSQCCTNNLIIPPGAVNGTFNANNVITFSEGASIVSGEFEICN